MTRYVFFGGKGGVGKTTMAAATAIYWADQGARTAIVSTDPTVSLSAVFRQPLGSVEPEPIRLVPNLCGMNINSAEAQGVFQRRLSGVMGQLSGAFGEEIISTPCLEEMAAFDQFVASLATQDRDVVVFDTAPTGKTLRELALPFNWAQFLERQIRDSQEVARLLNAADETFEGLEQDKRRYDQAMALLRDSGTTAFNLVLTPERLPIEETASAMEGLARLGIDVHRFVVNQRIEPEVIQGNLFLEARERTQRRFLEEIDRRFAHRERVYLPLFAEDVSEVESLRRIGALLHAGEASGAAPACAMTRRRIGGWQARRSSSFLAPSGPRSIPE